MMKQVYILFFSVFFFTFAIASGKVPHPSPSPVSATDAIPSPGSTTDTTPSLESTVHPTPSAETTADPTPSADSTIYPTTSPESAADPSPSPESAADPSPSLEPTSEEAEPWESNPLLENVRETDPEVLRRLRALRQNVVDNGCEINLCFALQGDDFITDVEFQDQQNFADLLVAILTTDEPGNFCAVQYGSSTSPISRLTGERLHFLEEVRATSRVGGFETNIAGALGYSGFQLRARDEDANKIILLGDGLDNVGFRPKRVAENIREQNIDISAVAVGQFSISSLTEITGDRNKIFRVDDFFLLAEVVFGLVSDVCGYSL